MGPAFLVLLVHQWLPNLVLVLMVAQRKEIGFGYLGLKGTYRKITLIRVNRLISDKQIPPNLDLRKETSALCQTTNIRCSKMALALHLSREKKIYPATVSSALPAVSPRSSFIPLWATWSSEGNRHILLSIPNAQTSVFGGICVCLHGYWCVDEYAGLHKDLGLSVCKYWLDPIQVPLLNSTLKRPYELRVHKDNQK